MRSDPLDAEVERTLGDARGEITGMVERLYDAVRRVSAAEMRRAFGGRALHGLTLAPTAIANDAMLRVLRQRATVASDGQFFALAARFVRQLVLDYQRQRLAQKRGAGARGASLDDDHDGVAAARDASPADEGGDAIAALDALADVYPRKAEVVALHVVCGHPLPRVAEMVGVSVATAERDWAFAKAWLADRLEAGRA